MSQESHVESIDPNCLYTVEKLRRIEGVSMDRMKQFIRENCVYSEPWIGKIRVLGSDYIDAHGRLSCVDTDDAKAARRAKSGAITRSARKQKDSGK